MELDIVSEEEKGSENEGESENESENESKTSGRKIKIKIKMNISVNCAISTFPPLKIYEQVGLSLPSSSILELLCTR